MPEAKNIHLEKAHLLKLCEQLWQFLLTRIAVFAS